MHWGAYFRARASKKNARVVSSREFIKKHKNKYPPKAFSEALGISLSRVYFILKNENQMKEKKDKMKNRAELTAKIKEVSTQHPYFGYRKVYAILKYKFGISVRRNTIYQLMKDNDLTLPATRSNKKFFKGVPFSINVEAKESNRLWGIDMTYIWCGKDAWCYLHAVIDHHDKTLLGYTFSKSCKAIGGVMALAEAASKRPVRNLELRSDNGCHYCRLQIVGLHRESLLLL